MRRSLENIPAYAAGNSPAKVPGVTAFKISSNENPYSPLPELVNSLSFAAINRYPDFSSKRLRSALAAKFNVTFEELAVGTGSVGLLQQIVQAVCNVDDEVIHAWRSFEAYPIIAAINAVTSIPVPLRPDESHDLDAMSDAITDRTSLILICQPNNPTGVAAKRDELNSFLDRVPSRITVIIDEAYVEFATDESIPNALEIYRARPNVAVLRTFSKAYGLAGLRVGYVIAHTLLAETIRKCTVPFGVSSIAEDAAVAALKLEPQLFERVDLIVAERNRVTLALRHQGWQLPNSQSNFVWLRMAQNAGKTRLFTEKCNEAGLSVRPYGDEGVRVTIGETEANSRFIDVAAAFLTATGQ